MDLFSTRHLVELNADFHRKLLDFLPVLPLFFLLVKGIVDQGANVVL